MILKVGFNYINMDYCFNINVICDPENLNAILRFDMSNGDEIISDGINVDFDTIGRVAGILFNERSVKENSSATKHYDSYFDLSDIYNNLKSERDM